MKTCTKIFRRTAPSHGFTIIELLIYCGVYAVLLGVSFVAFYRCFDNMKGLRRNSEDITRAIHAGEIWRNDIRAATRPIRFDESVQSFRIPQDDREVAYKFSDAQVYRKAGVDAPWVVLLSKVQTSRMSADPRTHVTAWHWELELQSARKSPRVKPLFTFLAIPNAGITP